MNDDLNATQVKKMFEVFEQTYGRRPVNQDEMVVVKSSEYRQPSARTLMRTAIIALTTTLGGSGPLPRYWCNSGMAFRV